MHYLDHYAPSSLSLEFLATLLDGTCVQQESEFVPIFYYVFSSLHLHGHVPYTLTRIEKITV